MSRRAATADSSASRRAHWPIALCLAISAAGCAMTTAPYQPSIDNVERLRSSGLGPMQVGSFTAQHDAVGATTISLRGSPMASSVGDGYADYLAAALRQELQLARLLDPKADIEVGGVLARNDISAGGIATNSGEIEAKFIVRRGGQVRFEKSKRATLTWESGFMAATALPLAQRQYPLLVQRLLGELLADPDFVAACR